MKKGSFRAAAEMFITKPRAAPLPDAKDAPEASTPPRVETPQPEPETKPQEVTTKAKTTKTTKGRKKKMGYEEIAGIKMYDIAGAADVLHVTTRTIQNYIARGDLKAQKIGGKWRISEKNLTAFLNAD